MNNTSENIKVKREKLSIEERKKRKKENYKRWLLKNPENRKKSSKKYYESHKKEIKVRTESYRKKYWEKVKHKRRKRKSDYDKEYHLKNKEKRNSYCRNWQKENSKKVLEHQNRLYRENPTFKLIKTLRGRLRLALKYKGLKKQNTTIDLLGCTPIELKKHLESKFKNGMSWENHAKKGWHIDHIVPISSFDLNNLEELKKACHWTNLQPLWWYENLSKSNKIL